MSMMQDINNDYSYRRIGGKKAVVFPSDDADATEGNYRDIGNGLERYDGSEWVAVGTGEPSSSNELTLHKSGGGTVTYTIPAGYTFDPETLYQDEQDGTITKTAETFPPSIVPYPDGWAYKPFTIFRTDSGYSTSLSADAFRAAYKVNGKKYYVSPSGNDANPGTAASPLYTVLAAYNKADVREIVLLSGIYNYDQWPSNYAFGLNKNISIISEGGLAHIGNIEFVNGSWLVTQDATHTNTFWYATVLTAVLNPQVMDAKNGTFEAYTEVASKALCNTTPHSVYFDTGAGRTYFNPGTASPVNKVHYLLVGLVPNQRTLQNNPSTPNTLYLEGIRFYGATLARSESVGGVKLYQQNVGYYQTAGYGDLLQVIGGVEAISFNCYLDRAGQDGFGYSAAGAYIPYGAEVDCHFYNAGVSGGTSNQLSTIHDGATLVRVGGIYEGSNKDIITDVGVGTRSFNVGVQAKGGSAVNGVQFYASTDAEMWLVDPQGDGAAMWNIGASNGATLYLQGEKTPFQPSTLLGLASVVGEIKYFGFSTEGFSPVDQGPYEYNKPSKPVILDALGGLYLEAYDEGDDTTYMATVKNGVFGYEEVPDDGDGGEPAETPTLDEVLTEGATSDKGMTVGELQINKNNTASDILKFFDGTWFIRRLQASTELQYGTGGHHVFLDHLGATILGMSNAGAVFYKPVNFNDRMQLQDIATPSAPTSGYGLLYTKNNRLYFQNNAGERDLLKNDPATVVTGLPDADYTVVITGPITYVELPDISANRTVNIPDPVVNKGNIIIFRSIEPTGSGEQWSFNSPGIILDGSGNYGTLIQKSTVTQIISNGTDWVMLTPF